MHKFMVTLTFPPYFSQDMIALIPKQREQIVELLSDGKIASFSLNAQRTHAWLVISARNPDEVQTLLESFPMADFFEYDIDILAVYDTAFMGLPKVVLN
ncbi:MAG: muconolactone Delta-isomerase family protein [Bacteroidota bacterium]